MRISTPVKDPRLRRSSSPVTIKVAWPARAVARTQSSLVKRQVYLDQLVAQTLPNQARDNDIGVEDDSHEISRKTSSSVKIPRDRAAGTLMPPGRSGRV